MIITAAILAAAALTPDKDRTIEYVPLEPLTLAVAACTKCSFAVRLEDALRLGRTEEEANGAEMEEAKCEQER